MSIAPSIFQRYTDNLLIGASVSASPAPASSYDIDTLLSQRPAARVLWDAADVTIDFTLAGSGTEQQADVLVIPVWNVDAGTSPAVARLTSGAGMDVDLTIPIMRASGIPQTLAVDLTVAESDPTKRTSSTFSLIVSGNSLPLLMGGAVLLYGPKRTFIERDWHWAWSKSLQGMAISHENEYGVDLVYPLDTQKRSLTVSTLALETEAADLEAWADANFGGAYPSLIWLLPETEEAFFGRLRDVFQRTEQYTDAVEINLVFDEVTKGRPVV